MVAVASIPACRSSSASGQLSVHTERGDAALEPAALMAEALRRAEADSGGTGLLAAVQSLRTISELSWPYRNPALAVARPAGDRAGPPGQHPRRRQPGRRDDRPGRRPDPGRRARRRRRLWRRGQPDPVPAARRGRRAGLDRPGRRRARAGPHRPRPTSRQPGRVERGRHASRCTSTRCSRSRCGPGWASASTSTGGGWVGCGPRSPRWRPGTPTRGSSGRSPPRS